MTMGYLMELEDFVSESLKQIIDGVRTTPGRVAENGAKINPREVQFATQKYAGVWDKGSQALIQRIKYDVAVTSSEGTKKKGGIGVFFGTVGLGTGGESGVESNSASRIKFSVPIVLPTQ